MKKDIAMKYNRRIYPIYKGIGWDPLFYSAIIFLFLSEVKGIEASKIMYAESIYALFLILFSIPACIIIERIGNRKSLILGSALLTIQILMMIFANNFVFLIIAYLFSSLGDAIKEVAQSSLLYDATSVCKGKNSFGNIDAKACSFSYILNSISLVLSGFLYVLNPYIPIILSSLLSLLAVIIACRLEEIESEKKEKTTISESLKDIKQGFKFIINSNRLKALMFFASIFVGVLMMISTYEKSLLKDLQIQPQYFGIIFALLSLVQCFAVQYQGKIHERFKNKTLAFLSIPIFCSFILAGGITFLKLNSSITLVIVMFAFIVQHFLRAPYWVLEGKYLTNFTTSDIRTKILSTARVIKGLGRISISFIAGLLLEYYNTSQAYIIIGVVGLFVILLVLAYMKSRVGLAPEEYDKKDIEYIKDVK